MESETDLGRDDNLRNSIFKIKIFSFELNNVPQVYELRVTALKPCERWYKNRCK